MAVGRGGMRNPGDRKQDERRSPRQAKKGDAEEAADGKVGEERRGSARV